MNPQLRQILTSLSIILLGLSVLFLGLTVTDNTEQIIILNEQVQILQNEGNWLTQKIGLLLERTYPVNDDFSVIYKQPLLKEKITYERRTVTMYNAVKSQTDLTPCITADGTNLCQTSTSTKMINTSSTFFMVSNSDSYPKVCAANDLPFGTIVDIDGLGSFTIHDRMNKRYGSKNIDCFIPSVSDAKKFGAQTRVVTVYSEK